MFSFAFHLKKYEQLDNCPPDNCPHEISLRKISLGCYSSDNCSWVIHPGQLPPRQLPPNEIPLRQLPPGIPPPSRRQLLLNNSPLENLPPGNYSLWNPSQDNCLPKFCPPDKYPWMMHPAHSPPLDNYPHEILVYINNRNTKQWVKLMKIIWITNIFI